MTGMKSPHRPHVLGRSRRRISKTSRKPRVVMRPVLAPLRSSKAFVPTVVPCTIESIRHDYTVGSGWRVTFGFTPRDTNNYLVLDDATLGQLDANVLAF